MSRHQFEFEVCADSVASALAAESGGADRVELCSALALGGLSPSPGLFLEAKRAVNLPLFVMLRPRPGHFCYDQCERAVILREAKFFAENGADGIVFGALTHDAAVDVQLCASVAEHSQGLPLTFHRAIDLSLDPVQSVRTIGQQLRQFTRILSSGSATTAADGVGVLHKMRLECDAFDHLSLMAGAGVNARNVINILQETGVQAIHASCSIGQTLEASAFSSRHSTLSFSPAGMSDYELKFTDAGVVRELRAAAAEHFGSAA